MADPRFALNPHSTSRRRFLKGLASAGVVTIVGGSGVGPLGNSLTAWAVPGGGNDTVLVSIFLRGAADGLNIVCPHGDPDYGRQRGSYALTSSQYDDLDGFFGLHTGFSRLLPWYQNGDLAFIHASGCHLPTRSHFVAQPNMETGLHTGGGWMQRAIAISAYDRQMAGLSIGDRISPQLSGTYSGQTIDTVGETIESGMNLSTIRPALEALYAPDAAPPLESSAVLGALETIDVISDIDPSRPDLPSNSFGNDLAEAATMIKADVGVRMIAIDLGGWDHHSEGVDRMIDRGNRLADALDAFMISLGTDADRVVVMTSSEFGREVRPNDSGGTEHGHGNVMMVLGPALRGNGGGQVLVPGGWPGLADADLWQGQDLQVTTDFRSVYTEVMGRHLGILDHDAVFPGFVPEPVELLGVGLLGDINQSGAVDANDVQAVLDSNTGAGQTVAGDLDRDGDTDLADALLLARQVGGD